MSSTVISDTVRRTSKTRQPLTANRWAKMKFGSARRAYGWPEDAKFLVPEGVYEHFGTGIGKRGAEARRKWVELFESYRTQYPDLAVEIELMQRRELPTGWDRNLPVFPADAKGIAGRDASGKTLNVLAQNIPVVPWRLRRPWPVEQNHSLPIRGAGDFQADTTGGKNLHFGIREHAMAAIVNGLVLSKVRALWRVVLHIQRLCQACNSPGVADGTAIYFRFHA